MRKLVFVDSRVSGQHIPVGVLRLEPGKLGRTLVIRDLLNNKLMENCIPVPKWAEPHVFDTWNESLKEKIVWPIPKNYIKSIAP